MNGSHFEEVKRICVTSGFVQKGNTFYRVRGDGVLQLIKHQYERAFQSYFIYIGLFSMYGKLLPRLFTDRGSIARYSVVNCFNQNALPQICAPSLETQTAMLCGRVIPWLDTIDTQKKMVTAISRMDRRWNDDLKIWPYLACGESNHAKKVIREIIGQHSYAVSTRQGTQDYSPNRVTEQVKRDDNALFELLELIDSANQAEINMYLQQNYERNLRYASFCRKENCSSVESFPRD